MGAWSLGVGRWFGVDLRLHLGFFFLFGVCARASLVNHGTTWRGTLLLLSILAAVAVRETARALAAAALALDLRGLVLLPTGAIARFAATRERLADPGLQARLALAGPLANLLAGTVLGGILLSTAPELDLLHQPWLGTASPLRALVWSNLLLGLLHLVPAAPLDAGLVLRAVQARRSGLAGAVRLSSGLTQGVAALLSLAGIVTGSLPLVLTGGAILLAALVERPLAGLDPAAGTASQVAMRDVMLVDFATLSASDTLEQALERAIHTAQDVFPVVRGGHIVGAVSRQGIVEALQTDGNGYVQGLMTRSLATAAPGDSLLQVLGRTPGGGVQILPIVEGERVLGIVTPQHLAGSMRLVHQRQRWKLRQGRP